MSSPDHWNPGWYRDGSDFQRQVASRLLRTLSFPETGRVLDIGCGDGQITAWIAETYPRLQVMGLDRSSSMIAFAQVQHRTVGNLGFIRADIQGFEAEAPFDLIVSFWALSWLSDHAVGARRIRKALKSGGQVLLLIPINNPLLFRTIGTLESQSPWREALAGIGNPINTASLETYSEHFPGLTVREERFRREFPDSEAFAMHLKGWLPHVQALEGADQRAFLEQFVATYHSLSGMSGLGKNTVFYDCIIVEGRS
jgi:trans-aconitate 2-methyltransferase